MKSAIFACLIAGLGLTAWADDAAFSTRLFPKFQVKACTNCHDFFDKELKGLSSSTHKGRTPKTCAMCHSKTITGFQHPFEWFARTGLYTSGMDEKQTCEAIKSALHAKFKSPALLARDMENHLLNDARVLWAIAGATPNSGKRPDRSKQQDLVKGGLDQWRAQIKAWIKDGMRCP